MWEWGGIGAKRTSTSRLSPAGWTKNGLAGVTGREAAPFCDSPQELDCLFRHVHNWAHKMCSQIVADCRKLAQVRGGDEARITLTPEIAERRTPADEILRVNDALDELAKVDGRLVQVVEMRYFGGLEEREIAGVLGVTDRTVRRDWEKARMLLLLAME